MIQDRNFDISQFFPPSNSPCGSSCCGETSQPPCRSKCCFGSKCGTGCCSEPTTTQRPITPPPCVSNCCSGICPTARPPCQSKCGSKCSSTTNVEVNKVSRSYSKSTNCVNGACETTTCENGVCKTVEHNQEERSEKNIQDADYSADT